MGGKTDVWQGTLALMVLKTLQLMGPQIMAAINAGRGAGRIKAIRWLLSH